MYWLNLKQVLGARRSRIRVRVKGRWVGYVEVARTASKREMELPALSLPEAQRLIGDATVKDFTVADADVVNIVI